MGILKRLREPKPKLVPGNFEAELCELFDLPHDAIFLGRERAEWITEEEAARRKANEPTTEEILEELRQDPDVQAVLEAFGHTATSKIASADLDL